MMKKLFFLCAFLFMSMQIQAQMYIVVIADPSEVQGDSCSDNYECTIVTIDPLGNQTFTCIPYVGVNGGLSALNQHLNEIMAEGYKITHIIGSSEAAGGQQGILDLTDGTFQHNITFFLAVP
jgi:hypothetical protein